MPACKGETFTVEEMLTNTQDEVVIACCCVIAANKSDNKLYGILAEIEKKFPDTVARNRGEFQKLRSGVASNA